MRSGGITVKHEVALRLLLVLALFLVATAAAAQQPTVVYVVRHAERADTTRDPGLSPAGEARALALADALRDANVTAIITTQFRRTQLTAAPLAQARGLTPHAIDAGRDVAGHARAIADAVRSRSAAGAVLVVGHSNTINAIVGALGGPVIASYCDTDYDNLLIVTIQATGEVSLARGLYGAADASPADCRR